MIRFAIIGESGSGKTSFARGLNIPDTNNPIVEPSSAIIRAGNIINDRLMTHVTIPLCDHIEVLKPMVDEIMPTAVAAATPIEVESRSLAVDRKDFFENPQAYEVLCSYLGIVTVCPELLEEKISTDNLEDHQLLLDWVDTYTTHKLGKKLWYHNYHDLVAISNQAEADGCQTFTAIDVLPDDALKWRDLGGVIIETRRPGYDPTDQTSIKPDIITVNTGTLDQLLWAGAKLAADAQTGIFRQRYVAQAFQQVAAISLSGQMDHHSK
jgi:hypothetical protein